MAAGIVGRCTQDQCLDSDGSDADEEVKGCIVEVCPGSTLLRFHLEQITAWLLMAYSLVID